MSYSGAVAESTPLLSDAISPSLNVSNDHPIVKSASEKSRPSSSSSIASDKQESPVLSTASAARKYRHVSYSAVESDISPTSTSPNSETHGNTLSAEQFSRRTLYGSLPFMAAFGMQKKESTMKKVISAVSVNKLVARSLEEGQQRKEQEEQEQQRQQQLQEMRSQQLQLQLQIPQSATGASSTSSAVAMVDEQMDGVDIDEITMTFHLLIAVIVAVISQFLVGYNTSVMNAPERVVFPHHSTLLWSLAVSAFAIGGPGGSILGGYLANTRGRKGAMDINNWIFLIGGVILTLAPSVEWLILARFIIGFASGVAMVVVPVYLGEIAPPTLRGTLGTCTQFAIVIGILASNLIAFPLATESRWRYLFMLSPILSIIQILASQYLVESPRWLLNRDVHSLAARIAIKRLRAFRSSHEVEHEVQNYLFAAAKHKTPRHSAHSTGAIWDLITAKDVRILLVSSVVLQIAQQLSGINAVFYYSTTFFEGVIANPMVGTTVLGIVNLISTIAALKLMDNSGRRTLLLWSSTGSMLAMLCIIASLTGIVSRYWALVAMMVFVSSFAIGLGPIPWLIVAELFDAKYVATAMSLACIVNWSCNFLVGLSFPFFIEWLGAWSFAPYLVVLACSHVFIYFYLPETLGKSVEEVYQMVTDTNQTHNFFFQHFHSGSSGSHGDGRSSTSPGQPTHGQTHSSTGGGLTSSLAVFGQRKRRNTHDEFEEKLVDMPVLQAVEMLETLDGDYDI